MRRLRHLALLPAALLLSGCDFVVLWPSGDVAAQQRDLLIVSVILMLLVIVPVMALTVLFALRYRQSNQAARYEPDWDHSTQLELWIWAAPLLIIICLGAATWMGTHKLDPYRPLGRIADGQKLTDSGDPLQVNVVALDWKWLFIYPQYGVATVNELAAPVDRPITFRITSSSVMNSFYIPALAGQIYAMPGMQTRLHAVINAPGEFAGFSANYSGAGFSGMHFAFHGLSAGDFQKWIDKAKQAGGTLDRAAYLALEKPSENAPVQRFATVDPALFRLILEMCVQPGKMCMGEMAAIDAKGGLGLAGARAVQPAAITYDKYARRGAVFGPEAGYVASICSLNDARAAIGDDASDVAPSAAPPPLVGAGLPRPPMTRIRALMPPAGADAPRPSNS